MSDPRSTLVARSGTRLPALLAVLGLLAAAPLGCTGGEGGEDARDAEGGGADAPADAGGGDGGSPGREDANAAGDDEQAFGTEADLDRAEELWQAMDGYRDWPGYGGEEGFEAGQSPHGAFLTYHLNDVARDARPTADGSIIVKGNYAEESQDALVALTVMRRIDGYAPEHGDWFWVKYAPDGSVMRNDVGTPLAGRVALGTGQGCIACHEKAPGEDYLFDN